MPTLPLKDPYLTKGASIFLKSLMTDFSLSDAEAVKSIELKTNHDLKAVEYWLKVLGGSRYLGDLKSVGFQKIIENY